MKRILLVFGVLISIGTYSQNEVFLSAGFDMISLKSNVIKTNLTGGSFSIFGENFFSEKLGVAGGASLNFATGGSFTARPYDMLTSSWLEPKVYSLNMFGGTNSYMLAYQVKPVTFYTGVGLELLTLNSGSDFFFDNSYLGLSYIDNSNPPIDSIGGRLHQYYRNITPYYVFGGSVRIGDLACRVFYQKTFLGKFKPKEFGGRIGMLSLNVSYKIFSM